MSSVQRSLVFTGNGWTDFEETVLQWLKIAAADSWRQEEPTVIAVPTRSHSFFLRELCLKHNLALAGVYFRTPGEFRDDLLRAFPQPKRAASREELKLLLSLAASNFPDEPLARSLAADSDSLLKNLDGLWSSGHQSLPSPDPLLTKILSIFNQSLENCGLCTAHDIDRALLKCAESSPAVFASTLIYGFSGRHWARFSVLRALAAASTSSTLLLWNPPNRAETVDHLWAGTWEEELGAAEVSVAAEEKLRPFAELADAIVSGDSSKLKFGMAPPISFRVGRNALGEARLALGQLITWLAQPGDARIAVLFPRANPCSRELSELLRQLDIPHNDTLGHASAHTGQERHWNLWLQLQENPTLDRLHQFVHSGLNGFSDLVVRWRSLDRAFADLLTDDLRLISKWLHSRSKEEEGLARIIDDLVVFPEKATWQDFIGQALTACQQLGWIAYARKIEERSRSLQPLQPEVLDRALFISWLREVVRTPNRQRAASGHHPYAKIQFLTYPDAELQDWSHIIFTGLNEGSWPPKEEEGGWLHSGDIRKLNRSVLAQGRQGQGHEIIRRGFSHFLTAEERRSISNRALISLLEECGTACCFTAALALPDSPNREASPSDFLAKIFWALHGKAIDSKTFNRLALQGDSWISNFPVPELPREPVSFPPPAETVQAWEIRRDPKLVFGRFDYSFENPPPKPLQLPAKSWQQALHQPSQIWFQRVLRLSKTKRYASENPGKLAEGTGVHAWLKHAFVSGEAGDRLARLLQEAEANRKTMESIYQSAGRSLPQVWTGQWEQSVEKAVTLAKAVLDSSEFQPVAVEFAFRSPVAVSFPGIPPLMLTGTIDLILSDSKESPLAEDSWPGKNLHVVDYKTGSDEKLSLKHLQAGKGVQIALYLLALDAKGAARVSGQILTTKLKFGTQLSSNDADGAMNVWKTLVNMQETVRLGMRGELRPEFSFGSDYPLATLNLDPDLIEARWLLSHPAMRPEET